MNFKKLVVLGTGGTIAGRASAPSDNIGYVAGQIAVDQLLSEITVPAGVELVAEQVAQIDSKDMSPAVWQLLTQRCGFWLEQDDVQGVVITHGTDTLEETAYFLQAVLQPRKPVVIACAMRPATSLATDGPQNLADAMRVASSPGSAGVVAVCAGTIHGALDVQKLHTFRLDAFGSGDAGPIGYVEEGAIRQLRPWPLALQTLTPTVRQAVVAATYWPRVEIVMSHAGASGAIVDALATQGIDGLVVACTGNGTIHGDLLASLLRHQAKGLRIVRATRCCQGQIVGGEGDSLRHSQGLSPVKARIALILELLAASA